MLDVFNRSAEGADVGVEAAVLFADDHQLTTVLQEKETRYTSCIRYRTKMAARNKEGTRTRTAAGRSAIEQYNTNLSKKYNRSRKPAKRYRRDGERASTSRRRACLSGNTYLVARETVLDSSRHRSRSGTCTPERPKEHRTTQHALFNFLLPSDPLASCSIDLFISLL